ncbi:MAG: competence protein ComEC [Patescibacteria group bacterium]|nr:competence protein ComEC [Patescibacteria group bacterium]
MRAIYNKALTLIMGKVYHKQFFQKLVILSVLFSSATFSFSVYVLMSLTNIKLLDVLSSGDHKSENLLQVHFLNIGQGDAIYIVAPNKNSMLIDSGPQNEKVIAEVQKFKSMFDRRINVLLATHADADHIGSMKKAIEKFQYQVFAYSGLGSDTKLFADLMSVVNDAADSASQNLSAENLVDAKNTKSTNKVTLTAGMSVVLDEKNNIRFDVLFPDFDYQIEAYQECTKKEKYKPENKNVKNSKNSKSKKTGTKLKPQKNVCLKSLSTETNLNSVVGKLSHGSTSFMLTGDVPSEVEKFIIKKYSDIRADVLKLGHHGSKTSTSPEFLLEVGPRFAVVSAGKENRYGHPHKKVLDTITEFKNHQPKFEKVLRTDVDGTISFESDGNSLLLRR